MKKGMKRLKYYVLFVCRNCARKFYFNCDVKHKRIRKTSKYYDRYAHYSGDRARG